MRVQLRIVAGSLGGRKLTCNVDGHLRPAPQMLREALFSILGTGLPGRPFFDLFAGTGIVGIEALSRDASHLTLVERDLRHAAEIEQHIQLLGLADRTTIVRTDVYRWVKNWEGGPEPVNIFLGPPYIDFERRLDALCTVLAELQAKAAPGSVLALQSERTLDVGQLPGAAQWDQRSYGHNTLLLWVRET